MSEEKTCKNCDNAYKRATYSFRRYGAYYCSYECLAVRGRVAYRAATDKCELWTERGLNYGPASN